MNLVLLTEGTGQGTLEKSNVSRLASALAADDGQRVHLEKGCGTTWGRLLSGKIIGSDAVDILLRQYMWLSQQGVTRHEKVDIYLFGFSRGALIARVLCDLVCRVGVPCDAYDARRVLKFARGDRQEALAAFRREGRLTQPHAVRYLGVWDTVDSTVGIDGRKYVDCPPNVWCARHAVSRDERRHFFRLLPLKGGGEELVFPGTHSDVGGTYPDDHRIADVALAWIANKGVELGLRLKDGVSFTENVDLAGATVHDSSENANNAWGLFTSVPRVLSGMQSHVSCGQVPSS